MNHLLPFLRFQIVFVFIAVVLLGSTSATCQASTTWHVDDDAPNDPGPGNNGVSDPLENGSIRHPFDSIQQAINAAVNGDTVSVEPGTYAERINFNGKAVHVVSVSGPVVTTVNAGGTGSVVRCSSAEGPSTMLEGFRLTGGTGTSFNEYPIPNGGVAGGGMFNWNSSPTVKNCVFIGNTAVATPTGAGMGGGMVNIGGSNPSVVDCVFENNVAYGAINGYGGGMYNGHYNSTPTLLRCTFRNNTAYGYYNGFGGGLCNQFDSSPPVTDCQFIGNSVWGDTLYGHGGGMFNGNGGHNNPIVTNCLFKGNTSEEWGGAMSNYDSWPTIINCRFKQNFAGISGGGLFLYPDSSATTVAGSMFCENTPQHTFGGWTNQGGNMFLAECCPADATQDDLVNIDDLVVVIVFWGNPGALGGIADINHDLAVNIDDLVAVITAWGPCP